MDYFRITSDPETVGKREMISYGEYDVDAPEAEKHLRYDALPDYDPVFSPLLIDKPTPVIDDSSAIGGIGFIMDAEVRRVLENHRLGPHRFYKLATRRYDTGEPITKKYYYLQLVTVNYPKYIDYRQSSFVRKEFMAFNDGEVIPISDANQLVHEISEAKKSGSTIHCTALSFKGTFPEYDLFYMHGLYTHLFKRPLCSSALKQRLEDAFPGQFIIT